MVQGEERNRWSVIQRELLEAILRKLTLEDYFKCRRVCMSWQYIIDDVVATKGTCTPIPQFPFLMLLPPNGNINEQLPPNHPINKPATLSNITHENTDTVYTISTNRCFEFDRVFSVQGWLVFEKVYYNKNQNYDLIMFSNPVSGEEFELPHLPLFPGQEFSQISVKLVFSSAPSSSDFFVVACATILQSILSKGKIQHRSIQQLAFCKVTDKSWTPIPIPTTVHFHEFVILDLKLYAMSIYAFLSGSITVFDLSDCNVITFEKLRQEPIRMEHEPLEHLEGLQYPIIHNEVCMLARDGDEILLVLHHRQSSEPETKGFRVFKLDMCGPRWVKVDDLGERVLLMDGNGVQVISAKEINLPRNLNGGNYVFFCITSYIRVVPFVKRDLGVFSLKDKRIRRFPLGPSLQSVREWLWFMPSLW